MNTQTIDPVQRLTRDMNKAAAKLSDDEARYLVDYYYICQDDRKRANNQTRALSESGEPNAVVSWLAVQSETLESQIKRALDTYTDEHPIGRWLKSNYGIGPVIAAGLLAHIDITRAVTAGHIWRYAGLDPTQKWEKGQKRPWNAQLKTLCWKVGQSFMKFSNAEECHYGRIYRERKQYELERNEAGGNAQTAAEAVTRVSKSTDAYKAYSIGKLPPAQIDARARRYAVKLFLSHLHEVWYRYEHGTNPPKPYVLEHGGHAHYIPPFVPFAEQPRAHAKAA
jgi:hypothetical protein